MVKQKQGIEGGLAMERISRRHVLQAGTAALLMPQAARAQSRWPEKAIRVVVGFAVGGQTDTFARLYSDYISKQTGATVVVENKTGALGSIAATEVKRAPADGHTLLFNTSGAMSVNRVLIKDLAYDTDRDFTLVSAMPTGGLPLVVNAKLGIKTLDDFVRYAKTAPRVSLGTFGIGSPAHLTVIELNKQYGLSIEPIHYRGEAPMFTDVIGQVIDGGVGSYVGAQPALQSGAGVVIAVPRKRLVALPDVPTFKEQGATSPLFELATYQCCAVAKETPRPIIERLSQLILEAAKSERAQAMFKTFGIDEGAMSLEETQALYDRESKIWIALASQIG
jgi:tripartite-type tricarboxylate transporter receptor subunit TctC